jgi:hypothetical protein
MTTTTTFLLGAAQDAGRSVLNRGVLSPQRPKTLIAGGERAQSDSAVFSAEAVGANLTRIRQNDSKQLPFELTESEQEQIRELKKRDAKVRRHEAAHVAAAGPYARGGPTFTYTRGPNGVQYATGGEVSIDVSPESTPEETLRKAAIVRRAALAPQEPSAQDRSVAAQASQLAAEARRDLTAEKRSENSDVQSSPSSFDESI